MPAATLICIGTFARVDVLVGQADGETDDVGIRAVFVILQKRVVS